MIRENPLPKSAPGFLVRALAMRRAAGVPPFTVLCCDNLPENGRVVRGVVLELAGLIDPALAGWIEAEGAFPRPGRPHRARHHRRRSGPA